MRATVLMIAAALAFAPFAANAAATAPAGVVGCYVDGIHQPACPPIDYAAIKMRDDSTKPQCIVFEIKRNTNKCGAYTNGVAKKY